MAVRRQVQLGGGTVELHSGSVVGGGGLEGGVESAEPQPGAAVGLADFGHPLPPSPLPHSSEAAARILRPAFPFHAPFS